MEVFQKTSKELREAVYQLLGYRLDVSTSGMYKLMNMYAESQDHVLLFQVHLCCAIKNLFEEIICSSTKKLLNLCVFVHAIKLLLIL